MPTISIRLKPSHRQSVLAAVTVTLRFEDGTAVEIHDCRVMRNRQGILWAALPTYSITLGKQYEYHSSVVLDPTLHRRVMDEILASYEKWTQQSHRNQKPFRAEVRDEPGQ